MTNVAVYERRKNPRTALGIAMNIRAEGARRLRGTIADLSASGMTFKTDAVLDEGMSLHLKLDLPLEIRGEVRHMKESAGGLRRYGVRFHKILGEC